MNLKKVGATFLPRARGPPSELSARGDPQLSPSGGLAGPFPFSLLDPLAPRLLAHLLLRLYCKKLAQSAPFCSVAVHCFFAHMQFREPVAVLLLRGRAGHLGCPRARRGRPRPWRCGPWRLCAYACVTCLLVARAPVVVGDFVDAPVARVVLEGVVPAAAPLVQALAPLEGPYRPEAAHGEGRVRCGVVMVGAGGRHSELRICRHGAEVPVARVQWCR